MMVFGVVTSNGDIMPTFIFPHSLRLNIEAYIGPGGGSADLNQEGGSQKTLCLATGL